MSEPARVVDQAATASTGQDRPPQDARNEAGCAQLGLLSGVSRLNPSPRVAGHDQSTRGELIIESYQSQALRSLLHGHVPLGDHRLGIAFEGARLVAVATPDERATATLVHEAEENADTVATEWSERVVAILVSGLQQRNGTDRARRVAAAVARGFLDREPHGVAGVSASLRSARDVQAAFRDARDAATLSFAHPGRVVFAEDEWAALALLRLSRQGAGVLPQDSPLRRLAEYDADHGGALCTSLATWLRWNGDTARAARALNMHANTLRYRLKRASEVAGLDLSDPRARTLAYLFLCSAVD